MEDPRLTRKKNEVIQDADLLLMYGARDSNFPPRAIIELFLDYGRFNRALRMLYRDDPPELSHMEKIEEELELNFQAGNLNAQDYKFGIRTVKAMKMQHKSFIERRIADLEAKKDYYEMKEEYEACAGIKVLLEELKNKQQ